MKKILTKKGFTLIELIVVIAILAILAAILIPSLTNYLTAAETAKDKSNARSGLSAVMLDYATGNSSPTLSATYTSQGCALSGTAPAFVVTCDGQTAP